MRAEALSLFRRLHRAAGLMPTSNRASFVRAKVRHEYIKMQHPSSFLNTIGCVVTNDLEKFVMTSDLTSWRETLAILTQTMMAFSTM